MRVAGRSYWPRSTHFVLRLALAARSEPTQRDRLTILQPNFYIAHRRFHLCQPLPQWPHSYAAAINDHGAVKMDRAREFGPQQLRLDGQDINGMGSKHRGDLMKQTTPILPNDGHSLQLRISRPCPLRRQSTIDHRWQSGR